MSEAFHLYVISFAVGKEAGLALVAAQDEKSAFQILKNGGSRHCDGYSLIQTRDIGMTANCHYGLLLESYVNAIEAFDAITQAANKLVGPPGVTSATAEIGPDTQEGPKVTLTMHGTELSFVFQNIDGGLQTLPIASDTTLGGVKIGSGLSIDGEGVLSSSGGEGSDPNAVKYTEQTLTDSQKGQARKNIGACSAIAVTGSTEPSGDSSVKYTVQDLTPAQKAQARQNIGAGTSSFSGSYNDLQDKPQQVALSNNVVADKSATNKAPSSKSFYDDVHPAIAYTQPTGGLLPNVFYDLGILTGNITINLASPLDPSVLNHYYFVFRTGDSAPSIEWPDSLIGWLNGGEPTLEPLTHYEISIIGNYAAFMYI